MMTVDHVLRHTRAVVSVTFSAGNADGAVTVTVVDAGGRSVATGNATSVGAGSYTFAIDPQPEVAELSITWAGSWGGSAQSIASQVEIVGGYLFTLAQARAYDAELANTTKHPDAEIRERRAGITDFFEQFCGISFVPRYARDVLDGDCDLWLTHWPVTKLLAASIDGVALTGGELAVATVYPHGRLYRSAGWWTTNPRQAVVEYEHGMAAVPWDIHQAALVYLRYTLTPSNLSERTMSVSNELGTVRLAVANEKYPTSIPAVDAALLNHKQTAVSRDIGGVHPRALHAAHREVRGAFDAVGRDRVPVGNEPGAARGRARPRPDPGRDVVGTRRDGAAQPVRRDRAGARRDARRLAGGGRRGDGDHRRGPARARREPAAGRRRHPRREDRLRGAQAVQRRRGRDGMGRRARHRLHKQRVKGDMPVTNDRADRTATADTDRKE
jgi:hypothetical protein